MEPLKLPSRARLRLRPNPRQPLSELDDRHRLLIRLLVHGPDEKDEDKLPLGCAPGKRMTPAQLADFLKLSRHLVTDLIEDPLFSTAYAAALQAKRLIAKPYAVERQIGLMDSLNETIVLGATKAILQEPANSTTNVNVGVAVNNQIANIKPGYVLRRPALIDEKAK
jgi:hypothetical protein